MNSIEQIREHIICIPRPFTTRQIVNEMALDYKYAQKTLKYLERDGFVKLIGYDTNHRKVYIVNRNFVSVKRARGWTAKMNKEKKNMPQKNTLEYIEMMYKKQQKKLGTEEEQLQK